MTAVDEHKHRNQIILTRVLNLAMTETACPANTENQCQPKSM